MGSIKSHLNLLFILGTRRSPKEDHLTRWFASNFKTNTFELFESLKTIFRIFKIVLNGWKFWFHFRWKFLQCEKYLYAICKYLKQWNGAGHVFEAMFQKNRLDNHKVFQHSDLFYRSHITMIGTLRLIRARGLEITWYNYHRFLHNVLKFGDNQRNVC